MRHWCMRASIRNISRRCCCRSASKPDEIWFSEIEHFAWAMCRPTPRERS